MLLLIDVQTPTTATSKARAATQQDRSVCTNIHQLNRDRSISAPERALCASCCCCTRTLLQATSTGKKDEITCVAWRECTLLPVDFFVLFQGEKVFWWPFYLFAYFVFNKNAEACLLFLLLFPFSSTIKIPKLYCSFCLNPATCIATSDTLFNQHFFLWFLTIHSMDVIDKNYIPILKYKSTFH